MKIHMFYHIITYGCQMNESDSERIAAVLENMGYSPAPNESEADLIVINVCSVRQRAIDRVFGQCQKLGQLKTLNFHRPKFSRGKFRRAGPKTILTGCILENDRKKLRNRVDMILDIRDLPKWPVFLNNLTPNTTNPSDLGTGQAMKQWNNKAMEQSNNDYLNIRPWYKSPFSAYVPITNGCNNFCSYCVVPYVRGREYSRQAEEIIDEVKGLVEREYREITLIGQNVNSYKSEIRNDTKCHPEESEGRRRISHECVKSAEGGLPAFAEDSSPLDKLRAQNDNFVVNFPKLLKMVNNIEGDFWVRFVTSHPKDMGDELIETVASCDKVCEYIHLPVQSGGDEILKKMNRGYTAKHYFGLVEKIRKKIPNVAISTDVIVGFPGETKKQFENSVKLFKTVGFDMAYIAQYSPRPGTAAAKLKDNIAVEEKKRRERILTSVLKATALENNRKYINKTVKVLVENKKTKKIRANSCSNSCPLVYCGRTRSFKNVKFESDKDLVGDFVKAKITSATPWGLSGRLCDLS